MKILFKNSFNNNISLIKIVFIFLKKIFYFLFFIFFENFLYFLKILKNAFLSSLSSSIYYNTESSLRKHKNDNKSC